MCYQQLVLHPCLVSRPNGNMVRETHHFQILSQQPPPFLTNMSGGFFFWFIYLTCHHVNDYCPCQRSQVSPLEPGSWQILSCVAKLAPPTNWYTIQGKRRSSSGSNLEAVSLHSLFETCHIPIVLVEYPAANTIGYSYRRYRRSMHSATTSALPSSPHESTVERYNSS
ncbi:hypothetical protein BJV77DRAFT_755544 [Russula vinacea]|nr:hypothetical protein BJV77DRAFT_755544 [Russula vinacea]